MLHDLKEIQFDVFRCSVVEKCAFRGSELIPLTSKEYAIFAALIEAQGQVVQKDNLSQMLWPDKVVEDSNLFHHVGSLRKKLGMRRDGKPYVETIPGRGYRLVVDAEERPDATADILPVETPLAPPVENDQAVASHPLDTTESSKKGLFWWLIRLAVLVILAIAGARFFYSRREPPAVASSPEIGVITSPESEAGPRVIATIPVGRQPISVVLNPAKNEAFVSEERDNSVGVIDTTKNTVTAQIPVGREPHTLALSIDKKRVFVANAREGVGVIDTTTHSYRTISESARPINDLVLTPDGKFAYLALGYRGLAKLDLESESVKVVSKIVFVRALAITPDGKRLYVSYQSKGPGGTEGHDAIGYFDTVDDRFAGAISGFANVGECLTASPDGSQIWENGADACDSPQYDHVGCPSVPGGLLNIFSTRSNRLVKATGVRGARLQCITFAPDGEYAAVATTSHVMLVRSKDLAITASVPLGSPGKIAFTADGTKAYLPVNGKPEVAVIQLEAKVRTLRLTYHGDLDRTVIVAILPGTDYDSQAVDPGSLVLNGVPVEISPTGSPVASIEYVPGYEGHSLIVHFKTDLAKANRQLSLVGKTYSGIRIRGVVDPL